MQEIITSKYSKTSVILKGFSCIDCDLEKIRWLRLGDDFRAFITHDIDQSIHEQDPDSIIHSIECEKFPEYFIKEDPLTIGKKKALILEFSVRFFLKIIVSGYGGKWELSVEQKYIIKDDESTGNLNLQQDFNVTEQRKL